MRLSCRFQNAVTDCDGKFTRADYMKCFDLFVADGDSYIIEAEFYGKVLTPSFSFALLNVNGDGEYDMAFGILGIDFRFIGLPFYFVE